MSRQQLYREEVATTSGCRDNNCTEKRSQQHHDVATTIVQNGSHNNIRLSRHQLQGAEGRDVSFTENRSRQDQDVATPPSLKTCRNNTEAPAIRTAKRPATRTATRTDVAMRALCRGNISLLGQFTEVQKEMYRN